MHMPYLTASLFQNGITAKYKTLFSFLTNLLVLKIRLESTILQIVFLNRINMQF